MHGGHDLCGTGHSCVMLQVPPCSTGARRHLCCSEACLSAPVQTFLPPAMCPVAYQPCLFLEGERRRASILQVSALECGHARIGPQRSVL